MNRALGLPEKLSNLAGRDSGISEDAIQRSRSLLALRAVGPQVPLGEQCENRVQLSIDRTEERVFCHGASVDGLLGASNEDESRCINIVARD